MPSGLSQYSVRDVGAGAMVLQGENLSVGIPPDQLPAILKAAIDPLERLNKAQSDTIAKLEREFGATNEQILRLFPHHR